MNWISVKERLPNEPGSYLVFVPTLNEAVPYIAVAWFEPIWSVHMKGWQLIPKVFIDSITHWCELTHPKSSI